MLKNQSELSKLGGSNLVEISGGVLIAVSTNLLSEEVEGLQSDSEIVWAGTRQLKMKNRQNISSES